MIVVNPDGTQHHYARVGGELIPPDPIHNPDYVAAADPLETLAADDIPLGLTAEQAWHSMRTISMPIFATKQ